MIYRNLHYRNVDYDINRSQFHPQQISLWLCIAAGIEAIAPKQSRGLHTESPVAAQIFLEMIFIGDAFLSRIQNYHVKL
mgnify:CR=1 FL=1|jgi:hypothetical protein